MWNATLICAKVYSPINRRNFKVGQAYEVCDGRLIDGDGIKSYGTYKNITEVKESFYADFKEANSENQLDFKLLEEG